MTSPEHTLVGVLGAFSVGLHSRFGWTAVVFVAVASNLPDLDGIPMLFDMERFEVWHRVLGHNVFSILLTSAFIAFLQHRFRWIERISSRMGHLLPSGSTVEPPDSVPNIQFANLFLMSICFQCVHLVCDITVSGGSGLSNWLVKPFWPVNDAGFVVPLIPWGDIGPTIIMMLGVIAIAKVKNVNRTAILTLVLLCIYMLGRGYARGTLLLFET